MLTRERPALARRSLLAGLGAAPAVMMASALPLPALAHPAADTELIAQAALVVRLAKLRDRAHDRLARKGDVVMLARGPQPAAVKAWGGTCSIEDLPVETGSGIERRFVTTMTAPSAEHAEVKRRYTEALAAWEAEGERLGRENGTREASDLCDTLLDRFTDAVDALAAMPATSPAGLAAKASAFLAIADEQETDLARSLARDAMRIARRSA